MHIFVYRKNDTSDVMGFGFASEKWSQRSQKRFSVLQSFAITMSLQRLSMALSLLLLMLAFLLLDGFLSCYGSFRPCIM